MNTNDIIGISSGCVDLDTAISGIQSSDLIVIGGRPSVGKTTLAISMAMKMVLCDKRQVAFFSLELSETQIRQRLKSVVPEHDLSKEIPFYIVDTPNMNIQDLCQKAHELHSQKGIEIIFIDYFELIAPDPPINNNIVPRFQILSCIMDKLKILACELKIPIVLLCLLNRDAQFSKVLSLTNLRDNGVAKNYADIIILINTPNKNENLERLNLQIEKNRGGRLVNFFYNIKGE